MSLSKFRKVSKHPSSPPKKPQPVDPKTNPEITDKDK